MIDWAKDARKEYLTGTAITIIVLLLILLINPRSADRGFVRRCNVCDHAVLGRSS